MKKSKKGFTLVELIVVLAILAVIAAIAVPTAFGSIEKARQSADMASVDAFNSAINMQAGLISYVADRDTATDNAKPTPNVLNSFAAAVEAAAIKSTVPQSSDGLFVTWHPPVDTKSGYFSYEMPATGKVANVGKKVTTGADFYAQLNSVIGTDKEIVAKATTTP